MFKNWFSSHKTEETPKENDKWGITVDEALKKYGSATAVLDALCVDYLETKLTGFFDPVVTLLMLERKERLKAQKEADGCYHLSLPG